MRKIAFLLVMVVVFLTGMAVTERQTTVHDSALFSTEPSLMVRDYLGTIILVDGNNQQRILFPPNKGFWKNLKLMFKILFCPFSESEKEKEKEKNAPSPAPANEEKMDVPQQTTV